MAYNYKDALFNFKSTSFTSNYHKWLQYYINFIERCKQYEWTEDDGPFEIHHIVPESWGGPTCEENLIKLPIRYHMIAHCYLYHTHDVRMVHAFSHMFITRNLDFQNNYFISVASECRRIVVENHGRRIVNLSTGKVYGSIKEAARLSGLKYPSTIRMAIEWLSPVMSTGHYWQYEDSLTESSYEEEIEKFKRLRAEKDNQILIDHQNRQRVRRKKIICLTTGEVFESSESICDKFGVTPGSVRDSIRHHTKMVGYYWMYYDDYDPNLGTDYYTNEYEATAQQRSSRHNTCVIDITTNTRYTSMREAAKIMNVHPNAIAEAVKTGHKCCGHLWAAEGDKERDYRVVELYSKQLFNTKKEASAKTGVSRNSITRSTLTGKEVKGTLWKNFDELDSQTQQQILDAQSSN